MANLSDKQVNDNYIKSRVDSRKKQWTDLDLSLTIHPIRKDIVPLRDDVAIGNALKNLLVSNFYERPFAVTKGANLRSLLFEPADHFTKISMRDNIKRVIKRFEPRVDLLGVQIIDKTDDNAYKVIVNFRIKENDIEESIDIVLRRLR